MKSNSLKHLLLAGLLSLTALNARADEEQDLIAVLQSSANPAQKCEACKKLRLAGTAKSVPALAAVLGEEQVSQAARYALEGMPVPEAGAVLREALGKNAGPIKVGLIDSLGWRHDPAAVPLLAPLMSDPDAIVASAAASALGRIGGQESLAALKTARDKVPPTVLPVVLESLLRCAERLLAEDKPIEAKTIYESLFVPAEADQIRVAAYAGLIRSASDGGFALVKSALEGKDPAAQTAALQLAGNIKNPDATRTLVTSLPKATPAFQIALLALLQQSGDVTALSAVLTAARSTDAAVRTAAVKALGDLGDATAVPCLAEAADSRDELEQAAARQALAALHRGDIAAALVAQLSAATPAVQLELVRALSARSEKTAVPELLRLARSDRAATRKGALLALGNLADGSDLAALVKLLTDAKEPDARAGVRVVFEVLAERAGDKQKFDFDPMVRGMTSGDIDSRRALLQISALFVDERLRTAIRAALKDGDERIRASAARALCDARDGALLPDLLEVARQTPELGLRSLALEGVIRLATDEGANISAPQRADTLTAAMALASRPEDKRMVLSGLARAPHRVTLGLAEKACADPLVKAEAELACLQIAQKLGGADTALMEASLTRLAAGAGNASVQTNAQALLSKLNSGWLCAGPYRQQGREAQALFDIAFPPEQAGTNQVQWQRAPGATGLARPGEVDLASIVGGNHCVVYLKTRVYVPVDRPALFSIGSDDGIKLWVNGELVHTNNAVRALTPNQDKAKGRLRQGWNDLLAKITQHTAGCGMILRITQENGKAVPGLRLDARGGTQGL